MCGYVSYNDPRLQPPEDDEMTPAECWEHCIHGTACVGLLVRLSEVKTISIDRAAETMGCADCDEWEEA